jgi:hypothetical protein
MATVLEPKIECGPAPESSDRSFGFVFAVVFALSKKHARPKGQQIVYCIPLRVG